MDGNKEVKIYFDGEKVGNTLVEFIGFQPDHDDNYENSEYRGWSKTITAIETDDIKTRLIEGGDIDYFTFFGRIKSFNIWK